MISHCEMNLALCRMEDIHQACLPYGVVRGSDGVGAHYRVCCLANYIPASYMNSPTQQYSHHVSVPPDEGVRVDKAITIERPISYVYSFWSHLQNLPCFMRHLESVTIRDELHSHWAVKTVCGKLLEWDAEVIEQRENEMISWRSTPGADVDNAGSVWFTNVLDGKGTLVRVELKYIPPAGKAGVFFAKILGEDADAEIEEDLRRLKALLEKGEMPATNASGLVRGLETARKVAKASDNFARDKRWLVIVSVAMCSFALGLSFSRMRT